MVIGIVNLPIQRFWNKARLTWVLENERVYLQGLWDGAQLVMGLLTDSVPAEESFSTSKKSASDKPEG